MSLKSTIIAGAAFLFLIGTIASLALFILPVRMHENISHIKIVSHNLSKIDALEQHLLVHNRESLLYGLSQDDEHLITRENAIVSLKMVPLELEALEVFPLFKEAVNDIQRLIARYLSERQRMRVKGLSPLERYIQAADTVSDAKEAIELLRQQIQNWQDQAEAQAATEKKKALIAGNVIAILVALGVVALLGLGNRCFYLPALALNRMISEYRDTNEMVVSELRKDAPKEFKDIAAAYQELVIRLANQRRSQMTYLAAVAHDLRNPLSAIKMVIELLIVESRPAVAQDDQTGNLLLLKRQIELLDRLLGDLVDVGRIEAGEFDLSLAADDLNEIVKGAYGMFKAAYPDRKIVLRLPDDPSPVTCDSERIRQVLNNVISNAIKYSPLGGHVNITVGTSGKEYEIAVTDSGVGIPEDEQQSIFEPFHRSEGTRLTIPGVGLGLAVSRKIVERHGGSMKLTSQLGKGTTFLIRLPMPNDPQAQIKP